MKEKNPDSENRDVRVEFDTGGGISRRRTEWLADGAYFFEDEFAVEGTLEMPLVTADGWLVEFLEIERGKVFFRCGTAEICPPASRIGIFYPSFSLTRPGFKNFKGRVTGIGDVKPLPARFVAPFVFEIDFAAPPPRSVRQVIEILDACRRRRAQNIELTPQASLLSLKAKKLIDENYRVYPSLSRLAARLRVSPEHLSRQFKSDFEMSPSAYLRRLRIADATFRLSKGEPIIEVSGEVGYNDLSRFYKQFRRQTLKTPGVCQNSLKPKQDN